MIHSLNLYSVGRVMFHEFMPYIQNNFEYKY